MKESLCSLFKVRPSEASGVLRFVLLFLLIQAGTAIGITTSDSLFLLNVGADQLPKIYILVPVMMLLYIPVAGYLTGRFGLGRFFLLVLAGLALGGVAIWVLLQTVGTPFSRTAVFYGAKVYSAVAFIALYSISWNFTYQYFTILEGKRLFAFFTGGSAIGAIFGGILINVLTRLIPVQSLFLVWAGLATLAVPTLLWIISRHTVIEDEQPEPGPDLGFAQQTLRLAQVIRRSHFAVLLLSVLFCAQVLTTLNEFQYLDIFSTEYPNEADLASLFGKLYIGVNIFNLVFSTFVFNRLALRFGVRNIALIQPIIYTITFGWLFLEFGMAAGLFGFFAFQGLMVSIDFDNTNLLLNALPSEAKVQVRTFIEGLAEPMATAAAGLFLLSFGSVLDQGAVSAIGIGGGLLYLCFVLVMRQQYTRAMVKNLKSKWLDFTADTRELLSGLGEHELSFLKNLARSRDPEIAPSAIGVLRLNDQPAAADSLLDFMSHVDPEDRRRADPLFAELLKQEDANIFRRIIDWLDRDSARIDTSLIQAISVGGLPSTKSLSRLLKSDGPEEQATAGLQLLKSWDLKARTRGLSIFTGLFEKGGPHAAAAIEAIGKTGEERYAHYISRYLTDRDQTLSSNAVAAVNRLANRESSRLIPDLLAVIRGGSSDLRIMSMDTLTNIGDADAIPPLLMEAEFFTAAEKRKAIAVVESAGLEGIPMAASVLRDRTFPFDGRIVAARALSRLAFPQFEEIYPSLIPRELELAYRSLRRHEILSSVEAGRPGIRVLKRLFLDAQTEVVEFVIELLSVAGRLPDFELLSASLKSTNPKERGNTIETIEQGIEQDLFQTLLPLIDSRPLKERTQFYGDHYAPLESTPLEIVQDALESRFAVGSMVAAQAYWELDPIGCIQDLRRKLTESASPQFRDVVLSLIGVRSGQLNTVETIDHLVRSPLFESFGVIPLVKIAARTEEQHLDPGDVVFGAGDPAEALYCIVSGRVQTDGPDPVELGENDVFGEDCLFSEIRQCKATSSSAHVLVVPRATLEDNIDIFPETALRILEYGIDAAR